MKKILIVGLVLLSIFIIYLANMDKEVYYLALGDSSKVSFDSYGKKVNGYSYYVQKHLKNKGVLEKYVYEYSKSDMRITDLIRDIKVNKKFKDITIKNALIKADLVTLSVNAEDVFSMLKGDDIIYSDIYDYIDDLTLDLEKLFKLMREYCKEDIIFVGYYNPYKYIKNSDIEDIIDYMNKRYKEISLENNIKYVDISDISEVYLPNNESIYLNGAGYRFIGNKVISASDKILFDT